MSDREGPLRIAYVNYGGQRGPTSRMTEALEALGHRVVPVFGRGPLELRDPATRRPRVTVAVAAHLVFAALRFGRDALRYRWNTPYAFDVHSRWAGDLVEGLPAPVDVILQDGALFSPGAPPARPYVVYVDHTRAMAERRPAVPQSNLREPPRWGEAWRERERVTYRRASALAAFSEYAARSLVEDYDVDAARVQVVGAGPNAVPDEVTRRDDGETVLFVGRDFERKGGPILLEAFARLRRRRPAARLIVAGPRDHITMPEGASQLGPVLDEHLPDLFAQATLFAVPTLREPFGMSFLDAMACGVPCIATRTEAVPEIVEDGRTGLLVAPADVASLAGALERLLASPALARSMGERGRQRVLSHFTWSRTARRVGALLEASVERSANTSAAAGY